MSSFLRFLIPSGLLLMLAVSSTLHAATDAPMFAGSTLTIHGETYTWSSATEENYDHNDIYTTASGQSVTVVRQSNGDTVTFRKVEPPVAAPLQAKAVPTLSAEESARIQRLERKEMRNLSVSATVHAGGVTVLRWSCHGKDQLRAVSNVDFRHLAGLGSLEKEKTVYTIFMGLGVEEGALSAEEAQAAKLLPADGRASLVLLSGSPVAAKEDAQALAGMEALLVHYAAQREELVVQFEQREVQKAAQELARQNAPPPGPRHAVVHFWPLLPEQKAALTAQRRRRNLEAAKAGTTQQPSNAGGKEP